MHLSPPFRSRNRCECSLCTLVCGGRYIFLRQASYFIHIKRRSPRIEIIILAKSLGEKRSRRRLQKTLSLPWPPREHVNCGEPPLISGSGGLNRSSQLPHTITISNRKRRDWKEKTHSDHETLTSSIPICPSQRNSRFHHHWSLWAFMAQPIQYT